MVDEVLKVSPIQMVRGVPGCHDQASAEAEQIFRCVIRERDNVDPRDHEALKRMDQNTMASVALRRRDSLSATESPPSHHPLHHCKTLSNRKSKASYMLEGQIAFV